MGVSPERSAGSEPAASPEAPTKPQRPDWLLGPDEAIAPATDSRDLEDGKRAADSAPSPWIPTANRDSLAPSRNEAAEESAALAPDQWSMPTRDVVTGLDMDDFRQRDDTAPSDQGPPIDTAGDEAPPSPMWAQEEELDPEPAETPEAGPRRPAPATAPSPAAPKARSVWKVVVERVRTDRRIQVAAAIAGLAAMIVPMIMDWTSVVPVGRIRRDPVAFDGQNVKLRGTVGEVFAVGSSHTYYLHDGRDTIVVFTRLQPPRMRQRVTVVGSVSTGYLEGVPRAALFQNAP
jgi:hypothetical protein